LSVSVNFVKDGKNVTIGSSARIGIGLLVIGAVVAVNQTTHRQSPPAVLGSKITRCTVDDGAGGSARVATGVQAIHTDRLTVQVRDGVPGAVLVPPVKISPGASAVAPLPVQLSLGVRTAGRKKVVATASVYNASSCPVAVSGLHVSARRTSSALTDSLVTIDGRDRVVIQPGHRVSGRAVLPVPDDGTWRFDGRASADVGASA
jgi:hypothetical protein